MWEVNGICVGLCPVTVFGISSVEPLGSAARDLVKLVRKISQIWVMGGGWNWLMMVCSGGLCC